MDEFIPVSPIPGSVSFDTLMHSPVGSLGPTEFTERSGNFLNSLINAGAENIKLSPSISGEEKYNPSPETMVPPVSFINQDPSAGMIYPLPSLDNIPYSSETTNCDQCGALVSNNKDAIMSHLQRCCTADDPLAGTNAVKIDKNFVDIKPNTSAISITYNGDEQVVQVNWEKYMRTLQAKMAPDYSFCTKSYTFEVPGLDPGMKLEAIDKNNPQSFCVATVVEVLGHRVRIRYDGYGRDSSNDFWCNFQAEELYPIGWCAQNSFPLQPPTGINCTLEEWRKFLTQTLTGALAAPKQLFPQEHYQPKVHAFQVGMKMEVIHPTKPYVFCPATVVKSLGPYYFLVATDKIDNIPSVTMCCHNETSTIFPPGWSYKNGIELTVPSGYTRKTFSWEKYVASSRAVYAPQHLFKKSQPHKFRAGQKLEAVDLEQPHAIRVATITNVMGRVLQLHFDGQQTRFQFVESESPDIHGFGWCKRTGHPLFTPFGKTPFRTVTKYEGSESCPKPLKLISFADVMGRNPTPPNVANPNLKMPSNHATTPNLATTPNHAATPDAATPNLTAPSNQGTPSILVQSSNLGTSSLKPSFSIEASPNVATAPNVATSVNVAAANVAATTPSIATSSCVSAQPRRCSPDPCLSGQENLTSSSLVEPDENGEDKSEKCLTLSPSDDDEDLSDEDGNCTGSERFYHNKNQIFFNKTCCCGPLLNPEEIKHLPEATEPGKVSTVIRIGLEMVAKCAKEPERVLEMMQEGSGVRLMVKHNGKILKKAITRVDSRPKLERYLKRFCRRLVCCEYFLSLTPVGYPCPDDCKADQYGNLQGPKGMKAKRAREYFETKHLGYEKKKRGRKSKSVANEAAAQRAAAGIVTSVFHKGNHVPLPNLNLPVNAIADHLRHTATKILHQVQASQGLSAERLLLHTKTVASPTTIVTQTTVSPTPPHSITPHPTTHNPTTPNTTIPANITHQPTAVVPPTLTTLPTTPGSNVVPTYGKPRLLPSPYGPPPLPVTTTTTVTSGATAGISRNGSSRGRVPNQPLPKKVIRPIIPAGPLPDGTVPLVEIPIKIPPANKLPLPSRSTAIPVTTITVSSDGGSSSLTSSAKPVFRLAPPKFMAVPQSSNGITTTTFSGRLVALPQSLATGASFTRPNPSSNSSQTTTLVTANQRPIPASISLTRSGPPPLIPARAISGTPAHPKAISQSVQIIRPRLIEGKVVSAAPNVCVTQRGTIVAAQVNKTSGTSSGTCVVNPVVGHSPDANAMMKKMFSVVRGSENCIPITIAPAKVVATINRTVPTQFAHIYPSVKTSIQDQKTNSSHQNTNMSHQNTKNSHQNTNVSNQHTKNCHQNTIVSHQNANVSHQNTKTAHQNTNKSQQNTNVSIQKTIVSHQNTKNSYPNANNFSENTSTNKTNQNASRPNQNTYNSYQKTNKFGNTNATNNSMVNYDKNANNCSQNMGKIKRYSLNVGGGMGAVTTAVRSGMLARENYKSPEGPRDTKHNITKEGGYSIKINESNMETKSAISGMHSAVTKISDLTANQFENIPKVSERAPNQSVIAPNNSSVCPAVSDEYPIVSEGLPSSEFKNNEPQPDTDKVSMNKQRSAWLHRRRKKKKVRFTYVKGKNKKKKEGENEVVAQEQVFGFGGSGGFVQEYEEKMGKQIDEQKGQRAIKREHDDMAEDDDKNDPTYAPPHAKRSSDFTNLEIQSKYSVHISRQMAAHVTTVASTVEMTSSYATSPKAEFMKGVLHAVQSSQHPSVKLRSPSEKQLHSLNGFSSPPKRPRFHSAGSHTSRKHRPAFNAIAGTKSNIPCQKISVSTNTSLPGCPGDQCLYHPENPRLWSIEQVGEYLKATDCKNYATYFMDQEIDGESLLMLSRSTLMQFTNMKLGPTLKLSNYIAQLRARVGMSKHT